MSSPTQRSLAELRKRDYLAEAMNALLVAGRLAVRAVGKYANRTPKMGLVEVE